ncbi:RnfABCDGE type electron transport complex subunit B [Pseudomonas sp. Marseille-QA0892]
MTPSAISVQAIDALLPQTQCGKCGHPGCLPYAKGIASGEAINKCPPGGQATVSRLAALLHKPAMPLAEPEIPPQIAFIREDECIGCTKCIQACPTDAILGAAKLMHTVIRDECTGCELCVVPCPVDCIDILPLDEHEAAQQRARADHFRLRHRARLERLASEAAKRESERNARLARAARAAVDHPSSAAAQNGAGAPGTQASDIKRLKLEAAMARVALGKVEKQFAQRGTDTLKAQVEQLREASRRADEALQRASPPKPGADEADIKKAKIAAAMTRAQVSKAERAYGDSPTSDQVTQLEGLRRAANAAQATLERLLSH